MRCSRCLNASCSISVSSRCVHGAMSSLRPNWLKNTVCLGLVQVPSIFSTGGMNSFTHLDSLVDYDEHKRSIYIITYNHICVWKIETSQRKCRENFRHRFLPLGGRIKFGDFVHYNAWAVWLQMYNGHWSIFQNAIRNQYSASIWIDTHARPMSAEKFSRYIIKR